MRAPASGVERPTCGPIGSPDGLVGGVRAGASPEHAYVPRVTRTSSISTSTRLPAPPSAATNRIRTVWPANASIDTDAVRHAPSTSTGAPDDADQTTVCDAVGGSTIAAQRVGGRRRSRRGRTRSGTSAAGRASPAASIARRADGRAPVEVVRWSAVDPAVAPGHERLASRTVVVAELLRRRRRSSAAGLARAKRAAGRRGVGPVRVDRPAAGDLEVVVERAAARGPDRRAEDRRAGTTRAPSGRARPPCCGRSPTRSSSRPGSP